MGQLARVDEQRELTLFELPFCQFSPTGLTLDQDIDFDNWGRVGRSLCMMTRSVQWWAGDWLRFGEHKWGEKYAQAAQQTGIEPQTLMNYAYVAGAIQFSRRRENLGWSHHSEVAGLEIDAQEEILAKAEAEGLTVKEVRRRANYKKAERELKGRRDLVDLEIVAIAAKWRAISPMVAALRDEHPLAFSYCDGYAKEMDWLVAKPIESIGDFVENLVDGGVWDLDELVKLTRCSRPTIEVIADRLVAKGAYERGEQEATEGARGARRKLIKPLPRQPRAEMLALEDDDE